jgi:polyhydroxybutyrate depolymerase
MVIMKILFNRYCVVVEITTLLILSGCNLSSAINSAALVSTSGATFDISTQTLEAFTKIPAQAETPVPTATLLPIFSTPTLTPMPTETFTPMPTPPLPEDLPRWDCKPGASVRKIVSNDIEREFRTFIPSGYLPNGEMPLVFSLHGYTMTAYDQQLMTGLSHQASRSGFIVVYPQGLGNPTQWNLNPGMDNGDVIFIRDLIALFKQNCAIDSKRVYVTGFSMGGGMANRLACELSDQIAAIAPVSGAYAYPAICSPKRAMPVLAFHGYDDHVVPYNGSSNLDLLNQSPDVWPPIPDWAANWGVMNGCTPHPETLSNQDGVRIEAWRGCRDRVEVLLYTIDGGGHTYPNGTGANTGQDPLLKINGNKIIWEFFERYALER